MTQKKRNGWIFTKSGDWQIVDERRDHSLNCGRLGLGYGWFSSPLMRRKVKVEMGKPVMVQRRESQAEVPAARL